MINWLMNWYAARCRKIDLEILWPECKAQAPDMTRAKAAFAIHAYNDWAWERLGEGGIYAAIEALS